MVVFGGEVDVEEEGVGRRASIAIVGALCGEGGLLGC